MFSGMWEKLSCCYFFPWRWVRLCVRPALCSPFSALLSLDAVSPCRMFSHYPPSLVRQVSVCKPLWSTAMWEKLSSCYCFPWSCVCASCVVLSPLWSSLSRCRISFVGCGSLFWRSAAAFSRVLEHPLKALISCVAFSGCCSIVCASSVQIRS